MQDLPFRKRKKNRLVGWGTGQAKITQSKPYPATPEAEGAAGRHDHRIDDGGLRARRQVEGPVHGSHAGGRSGV